ncbi:MAG: head-tail connector protein [Polymorphobacter sp.]
MATQLAPMADAPVSLDEVKAFLRIDGSAEDGLLATLIRSASELAEAFTGQKLIARDFAERIAASSTWTRLKATPVVSIDGVDGSAGALPGGSYEIDIDASGDGWVRIIAATDTRVTVRYRAGMASDWNAVPEALRLGITRLVSHLYTHRDRDDAVGVPTAVVALWRPWRRMRL